MKLSAAFALERTLAFFICLQTTTTLAQTQASRSNLSFIDTFRAHWSTAKVLALAVADAMPSESYNFKPVSAEVGYREQMLHIAQANYGYCAFIADTKSPYADPVKDAKVEKAAAMKDLEGSFDYCTKVFDGLDESKLSQMHGESKGRFSALDVMLGVMIHMSHHRGQADVYLRVKGIVPPEYKW